MRPRTFFAVALVVGMVGFWSATPAHAGGWAVVTMDTLPATFTAGQEYVFGFTVRQHGIRPAGGITPSTITFRNGEQRLVVSAPDAGPGGHYAARVTFPTEGAWQWTVENFGTHPMPPLTVTAAAAEGVSVTPERPAWLFVAIPALVAVALAGFLSGTRGRRRAPTFALR